MNKLIVVIFLYFLFHMIISCSKSKEIDFVVKYEIYQNDYNMMYLNDKGTYKCKASSKEEAESIFENDYLLDYDCDSVSIIIY